MAERNIRTFTFYVRWYILAFGLYGCARLWFSGKNPLPLLSILLMVAAYNIFIFVYDTSSWKRRLRKLFSYTIFAMDTAALTLGTYLYKGLDLNTFFALYFVILVGGSRTFRLKGAFFSFTLVSALYVWLEIENTLTFGGGALTERVFTRVLIFFFTSVSVGFISQEAKRQMKEKMVFSTLFEMGKKLMSAVSIQEVIGYLLDATKTLVSPDVWILLAKEEGKDIFKPVTSEPSGKADLTIFPNDPAYVELTQGKKPVFKTNISPSLSLVLFPIQFQNTVTHILCVGTEEKKGFSHHLVFLLSHIVSQAGAALERVRLHQELQESYVSSVAALAAALDAKDGYTHGHARMVGTYAKLIAEKIGLPPDEVETIRFGGDLHDLGKIGIDERILRKPASLTAEEFSLMTHHPNLGADIVKTNGTLRNILPIILYHHERYDGQGYPQGLKGEEIPFGARIVMVADAFHAMTSDRPYRKALSRETAVLEIRRCSGTQFDPRVVEAFLLVLAEEDAQRERRRGKPAPVEVA